MMSTTKKTNEEDILEAIYDDPVLFVRELLSIEPAPWQIIFLKNVAEHPRCATRSGHGVGKTTVLAWLALWMLLTRFPIAILITSPSASQIDDAFWRELERWRGRLPAEFANLIEIRSTRAWNKAGPAESFCTARTASKDRPEALQGIHEENIVIIVDEASGVDEAVFNTIISGLSTENAKMVLTGNPTRTTGFFYDAFHTNSHLWVRQRVSTLDCAHSKNSPLVEMFQGKEGTNEYRIRILGEFPSGDADTVIPRELIELALVADVALTDASPIIWGVDVARYGDDRTVLIKRQGNSVLAAPKIWQQMDTMGTAQIIEDEYNSLPPYLRPDEIYVDANGLGAGVADRLRQLGLPAIDVMVQQTPSVKERFMRLRDELWFRAREWFERRNVKLPDEEEHDGINLLVAELCTPTYRFEGAGKIKVESKDEMKRRGFRSCDIADAFCMTMMNTAENYETKNWFNKNHDEELDALLSGVV